MHLQSHTCSSCGTKYIFSELESGFDVKREAFVCHKCAAKFERKRIIQLISDPEYVKFEAYSGTFWSKFKLWLCYLTLPVITASVTAHIHRQAIAQRLKEDL